MTAPSFGVFASAKVGAIVEEFIEAKAQSCTHGRIANLIGSLVAASRFTHAALKAKASPGTVVSAQPVEELTALQAQCKAEALEEAKAAVVKPPKAWLDWEQCQQARLRSEQAVAAYKGTDATEKLALVRKCCVLKLLTALPPDRVRVYHELQLSGSLKYRVYIDPAIAHQRSPQASLTIWMVVYTCHDPKLMIQTLRYARYSVQYVNRHPRPPPTQPHACIEHDRSLKRSPYAPRTRPEGAGLAS
ncbi:hypothetical protein OAO87_03595 [bacterium]|nr:hypothetical protein [bacterium]